MLTITFKEQLRFWMPSSDDHGIVHPKATPEGGVVFTFGDKNKKMSFIPSIKSKSSESQKRFKLKVISGWQVLVRLPANWMWLTKVPFSPIKEWAEVETLSMSISDNKVKTVGGKKVLGKMNKQPVSKPFAQTLRNWSREGELLLDPLESSEDHLSSKRTECGF